MTGIALAWLALMLLPVFTSMYYMLYYYILVILLLPFLIKKIIDKDNTFYNKWTRVRKKGFWKNVLQAGLRSFIVMTVVVCLSQLFGNGYTPSKIVSGVPAHVLTGLGLFLFILSFIIGIIEWYENEKKYNRILLTLKYQEKDLL
ncbi:hypothetical protein D7Z54_27100 [Salibacterium salarium]|uniref:Uncharacterized protein n=1 Tax=Salibacterium salarium TaxID=284579 RepID=A0A428MVM7_9BACI|nr:hypothetical protein [Salibacterium salarium]RSL30164.1 hypothetical protein D7Z54_27100 [Salibacterium salarium]